MFMTSLSNFWGEVCNKTSNYHDIYHIVIVILVNIDRDMIYLVLHMYAHDKV